MSAVFPGTTLELADASPIAIAVVDTNGDQLPAVGTLPVSVPGNVNVTVSNTPLPVTMSQVDPANATLTQVASSASSVTILAANANRHQFIVYNQGSKILYLAFHSSASLTAYTVQVPSNTMYESSLNGYTGIVTGIWNAANGTAVITEITT